MTIKRRLFISNILMIIIPFVISFSLMITILFLFVSEPESSTDKIDIFHQGIRQTDTFVEEWSEVNEIDDMQKAITDFNKKYQNENIRLFMYDGQTVYPKSDEIDSTFEMALSMNQNGQFIKDETAIYRNTVNNYTIFLIDTDYPLYTSENISEDEQLPFLNFATIAFLVAIGIILLTNRFLTRFVFKHILDPLDTLAYGVHQIRDGNLEYRIIYKENDEFKAICNDFNEMGQRLYNSVQLEQKNEQNRRELIAGIAHDLRTPLTSIKAYIEGLEKGVAKTEEDQNRYWDIIKYKTNDLEHIVKQLFLFSKLDVGEFPLYLEKINIKEQMNTLVQNIKDEYQEKHLHITLEQTISNEVVDVDVVQLKNAIINILENSVKYKDKAEVKMKIFTCLKNDKLIIILSDNGPGVKTESLESLFDVFYRVDRSRNNSSDGSGLGLAITKKILEQMNGTITAENVNGGGLAMIITLPIVSGGTNNEKNSDY